MGLWLSVIGCVLAVTGHACLGLALVVVGATWFSVGVLAQVAVEVIERNLAAGYR